MCSTSRTTPRKHFQGGINVDGDKVAEKWKGLWLNLFQIHVWSSHWLVYKGVRFLEYVSLINRNYKPGFLNTFTKFPGRFYVTDVGFSPPLWLNEFCWKDGCIKVQMRVLHTKGSLEISIQKFEIHQTSNQKNANPDLHFRATESPICSLFWSQTSEQISHPKKPLTFHSFPKNSSKKRLHALK